MPLHCSAADDAWYDFAPSTLRELKRHKCRSFDHTQNQLSLSRYEILVISIESSAACRLPKVFGIASWGANSLRARRRRLHSGAHVES